MAIISFWSNGKAETGKSASIAAITTYLAVEHNYKILILDTKYNDYFYQDCYWQEDKTIKLIQGSNPTVNIASGITGLIKAIRSNKTSPEIITNYTKIIFTDRLELLTETNVVKEDYDNYKSMFKDIAKIASKYYDLVFIDMSDDLGLNEINSLLDISDLIIANLSQSLRQINEFLKIRKESVMLSRKAIVPILGRYDENSKYNIKNLSRYMKEKELISVIPYNTLFFEACSEGQVDEFFIKFRKLNPKDKNAVFIEEVKNTAEKIIAKLQELQMRM